MDDESHILFGGSRGIGAAVAEHLVNRGINLFSVSRTRSKHGRWIEADISTASGLKDIAAAVGDQPLDALLFLAGIWETGAFTSAYEFESTSDQENRNIIATNLIAPIELLRLLSPNLVKSKNPRALFIGSLSGLDNAATPEVANTASKFGLRGAVEAMRLSMRGRGIAFTVINPGNVDTDEVKSDISSGRFEPQTPIPMSDLIAVIECALAMSPASEVRSLDIAQRCSFAP